MADTKQTAHTPWDAMKVGPTWTICEGTKPVADLYRGIDTTQEEVNAKAALIVRAVNSHEVLVEALKLAREYVKKTHGTLVGAMGENNLISPDLEKVDAALKQAGGE